MLHWAVVDVWYSTNNQWSVLPDGGLSEARGDLSAAAFGSLLFFGGGGTNVTAVFARLDIFNVSS
jgi:hypothetical protein